MKHTEIFAREDVEDALDEGETIERLPWRHGTRNTIHFTHLGKDWTTTIDVHSEDGWQLTDTITATEVKKVIKSIEVWEPINKEHETK
jgi:hypothetical protein